jgi:uridine phosphorylase
MSDDVLQYHIQMKKGDVGRYVLLPGDPGRSEKIAAHFDNPRLIANNREYVTYTGTLLGEKVSVTSTGIGCPSAAIAVEELIKIGADTFIRVGTSGGLQPGVKTGDVAIVNAAIRDEGTSTHYLPVEFPAVADVDLVVALREGAQRAGIPYHVGVTQSKDSFYGELEPERMPMAERLNWRMKAWVAGGAICSEMEASTIFIIAGIQRKRASGVMVMHSHDDADDLLDDHEGMNMSLFDSERAIRVAIEGIKVLIEKDKII